MVLPDQHMRDLTEVYRREKDFLKRRKNDEILVKTEEKEETAPIYYMKEQFHNIPCNCETSSVGRLFQSRIVIRCLPLEKNCFR
jgi:hypothetical protein